MILGASPCAVHPQRANLRRSTAREGTVRAWAEDRAAEDTESSLAKGAGSTALKLSPYRDRLGLHPEGYTGKSGVQEGLIYGAFSKLL